MENKDYYFPNEPTVWNDSDKQLVRDLFAWVAKNKGNDINITTGDRIVMQKDGEIKKVTRKLLNDEDAKNILYVLYDGENARASLLSGEDKDFSYSVSLEDGTKYRFRVNATAITVDDVSAIQITARTIDEIPKRMKDLGVEEEIYLNCIKRAEGLAVITGSTGTGKSTLLASMIRGILEDPESNKKIITYEAPIEFVYNKVKSETSIVSQTEIYKQLPNFKDAIRNALRRAPDIILIGEARDAETIGGAIIASQSGHLVLTTSHTNGVSETIKRLVNEFAPEERNSRALDVITALNIIVSQKLLKKVGGGRVAIKEYLVFTDAVKKRLQVANPDTLSYYCNVELRNHGQTFFMDAQKKYDEGLISKETLEELRYLDSASEKDMEKVINKA